MITTSGFFDFEWLNLSDISNNRLCSGLSRPALYRIRHSPRIAVITFVAYNDAHSFTPRPTIKLYAAPPQVFHCLLYTSDAADE